HPRAMAGRRALSVAHRSDVAAPTPQTVRRARCERDCGRCASLPDLHVKSSRVMPEGAIPESRRARECGIFCVGDLRRTVPMSTHLRIATGPSILGYLSHPCAELQACRFEKF